MNIHKNSLHLLCNDHTATIKIYNLVEKPRTKSDVTFLIITQKITKYYQIIAAIKKKHFYTSDLCTKKITHTHMFITMRGIIFHKKWTKSFAGY